MMDVELEGPICAVSSLAQKVARVELAPRSADKVVQHIAQRTSAGDGSIASNVAEGWKPKEKVWVAVAVMGRGNS